MSDVFVIIFTVAVVTGLIYLIYMLLLESGKNTKKVDLQISTRDILEQVQILFKQKKYSIVENLAKKYLEKNPAYDDLRTILAKSYFEDGNMYDALKQALIIIKRQPANFHMRIFLANCYKRTSQSSKAINELKELLRLDNENVVAVKELAQIYLETNQKQSAIKMYLKFLTYIDNNLESAKVRSTLAQLYIDLNDYDEAISQYKAVLEIYPEDIAVKKNIIELYKKTSDDARAIQMCEELLSVSMDGSEQLWFFSNLIDLYLRRNNSEKALEYANLALQNPTAEQIPLKEKIAEILVTMGRTDESIKILKDLAVENEEDINIKRYLARTFEAKKDFVSAVQTYKEILDIADAEDVLQIHREISNIYANWAMELFDSGENAECFKIFTTALHYDNENPRVYYKLGLVNQLIKNYNEAINQYKKAVELDNTNSAYYMAMSECFEAINNVYEEKKAIMEALRYDDHNAYAHYKLAVLNAEQNDTLNAISSLTRAIDLDDNLLDAKYRLALMYERHGKNAEAIALYEKILEKNPLHEGALNNLKMIGGN